MNSIAVLDFGSQYTRLIARRIREAGVFSAILPHTAGAADLRRVGAAGVVLSGGPASIYDDGAPTIDPSILDGSIPVLGICYGMQAICGALGGRVARAGRREYGPAEIALTNGRSSTLLAGLGARETVWMSHGDRVEALPAGFRTLAASEGSPCVAFEDEAGRRFGLQFHPEVAHTPKGREILSNFVRRVCGCAAEWTPAHVVETAVEALRLRLGSDAGVVLGVSGGVDSMVAAALLRRAVGDRVAAVFVDHGLLRHGEAEEVRARYAREIGGPFLLHDASARFFAALRGVADPEEKRRRIGRAFVEAFAEAVRPRDGRPLPRFLAQGTLYPDVIESVSPGGAPSAKIKTHHNVGGLPDDLPFEIVEPLRDLFKDEVRRVGAELGLSRVTLGRHPFPGPGLAIRVIGEATPERVERLRAADRIFVTELQTSGWYDRVAQAFAVLLPVRSVGVQGDGRTYEETVALRAVTTDDFMTADWADLPADLVRRASARITNEVRGVNRVVYDVSSKPPATIEWE